MRIDLKDKLEKKFQNLKPLEIEKNQDFIDKLLDNYRDTQMNIQEKKDIPLQEKKPTKQEIDLIEKQRQLYLSDLYQVVVKAIIDSAEYLFKLKESEKEVGSGEALSVSRGSSHEVELEQGHSSRVSPQTTDTTSSENSKEENLVID